MEHGIVIKTSGADILVEAEPGECCDGCGAKGACILGSDPQRKELWMKNTIGARVGDEVVFIIKERAVMAASVILYFFPVLMLFAGLLFGAFTEGRIIRDKELSSVLWGAIFLIMSFIAVKIISAFSRKKNIFMPFLVEVIRKNTDINN